MSGEQPQDAMDAEIDVIIYPAVACFGIIILIIMCRCCFSRLCWEPCTKWCCIKPMLRSPNPLKISSTSKESMCFKDFQTCMGCLYLYSPIDCRRMSQIQMYEAIHRYNEPGNRPPMFHDLIDHIANDELISLMLEEINAANPQLFLKVLPTGSLREQSGKILPSTSVLASDHDLMLIPGDVDVGQPGCGQRNAFELVPLKDEPGYVWLRLNRNDLTDVWTNLCFQKQDQDGTGLLDILA
ncbi:uncharacterized protein [Clytia hemisphaerica]|uniref:uncharacterized protein isoform X2 n=1 Tax=Clytia hemisphaerica TaxID=252671 RepID=UPI0034D57D0A